MKTDLQEALVRMTDSSSLPPRSDVLDHLTASLLDCGGVLSQIVAGMARYAAAGQAAADTMTIPEAAHAVVLGALEGIAGEYSRRDLQVAARIVDAAAGIIPADVLVVDPDWLESLDDDDA